MQHRILRINKIVLMVDKWNWVSEVGYPTEDDLDWCYIFTKFGSIEVAGYREE